MKQLLFAFCMAMATGTAAQTNGVSTYMNPIMGDHADQTVMRVGKDFYCAGSSFHYNPFIPILHSTDLVHWEIISRVVPSNWSGLQSDAPGDGTWQGGLAEFGGYFWLYFSNYTGGGQYFCKATSMKGPWSAPTKVTGSGVTGYDNSIFVDDDGTPYMIMKNGANVNRILKLDKTTGNSTGTVYNMDWLNPGPTNTYKMAEGPVMCKRNGRYYYFFAGDVYGGQWVISSATLTGTQSAWSAPTVFFKGTASLAGFTAPNHMTQPIKLDDGTWWCLVHGYGLNGWRGQGRISTLHEVLWDANGVPYANHASSSPVTAPNLPNASNIAFNFPREDYFSSSSLGLAWFFWNKANATKYSLSENPGYLRLKPGTGTTHALQQEAGRAYTMTTKVTVNATAAGQHAGLRIQNGNDDLQARVYVGNGKIGFGYNGTQTEVNNTIGSTVWLRLDRDGHNLKGFFSADGKSWTQVGSTVSATALDDYTGTAYNEWVGNAIGIYATGVNADFDLYKYRDSFAPIAAAGHNNFSGVTTSATVTNSTNGGWIALAGVSIGSENAPATQIIVNAASAAGASSLEVWIDNIGGAGTKIATIPITASGGASTMKDYTASVSAGGQHDLYIKFVGAANTIALNTVRFAVDAGAPVVNITAPINNTAALVNSAVTVSAAATDADGTISKVEFYAGTTLIGSDNSSPYSITWTPDATGTYSITAKATDNANKTATSAAISVIIKAPQAPYAGSPAAVPGTIQFENYDTGGNSDAYLDNEAGNTGGASFRTDEDVDIETCTDAGAGYNIGYATAGEWLEYTVNVAAAGIYDLTLRVACNADGRTVSLASGSTVLAKDIAIPNTAGWQAWQDVVVKDIDLKAGTQVLRLTIGASDYVNLNYMTFTAQAQPVTPIQLKAGWNLVGYPYEGSADIAAALSSVWANVQSVKTADAFYDKSATPALNTLTKLDWSKGYYVKVDKSCELRWAK